ncbi:hypothetical protein MHBO_004966, partial [Bonamia ostreae]
MGIYSSVISSELNSERPEKTWKYVIGYIKHGILSNNKNDLVSFALLDASKALTREGKYEESVNLLNLMQNLVNDNSDRNELKQTIRELVESHVKNGDFDYLGKIKDLNLKISARNKYLENERKASLARNYFFLDNLDNVL